MASDVFYSLTLLTSFLCMAISLWFAIYLLSRSHANFLTFRAIVALIALAFYYNSAFTALVNPSSNSDSLRSLASMIALIAVHDLTHYLLPPEQRQKLYWVARGIILLAVVAIVILFTAPDAFPCSSLYTCPTALSYPWAVIDLFKVIVFIAILYNLWQIRRSAGRLTNIAFYLAVLLGASTVAYGLIVTVFNVKLPMLLPNLLMLSSLLLLTYSVARDQTLITHRTSTYDLPITMLTIAAIVVIYIVIAWQMELSPTGILLLVVLAIFTHSIYDFVREFIDQLFRKQEHQIRQELRELGRDTTSNNSLERYLRRGLALLCHNLQASSGFIALHQADQVIVVASLHSLPIGTQIPAKDFFHEKVTQPTNPILQQTSWLAPAFVGNDQVAIVGVGPRKDKIPYSEEDLYWLEDIAAELGWIVNAHDRQEFSRTTESTSADEEIVESPLPIDQSEFISTFAYNPDPEVVKCIEDGFRHLHDYSQLGESPLVAMFGIQGEDHIASGKLVQQRLTQMVDKLRPSGNPPSEPLPTEWYAYTILHDAYIEEKLTREIMAKLYVSEGTYYRMRRHALRGVTRALLEMGNLG